MAEIPSWMWILSGVLITGFSVFMGYIRPVPYSAFFRLMLWVGLIMLAFGAIKWKLGQKTKEDMIDEMRRRQQQRGQSEVELGQRQMNTGYPQGYQQNNQYQQPAQHHRTQQQAQHQGSHQAHHVQHNPQHAVRQVHPQQGHPQNVHPRQNPAVQSRFCHQCGTPLLNHHKFCPMCGSRV